MNWSRDSDEEPPLIIEQIFYEEVIYKTILELTTRSKVSEQCFLSRQKCLRRTHKIYYKDIISDNWSIRKIWLTVMQIHKSAFLHCYSFDE
jgi:hypothetical protein